MRRFHEELPAALEVLRGDIVTARAWMRDATTADAAKHRVEYIASAQATEATFAVQLEQWLARACDHLRHIMAQEGQDIPDVVQAELKTHAVDDCGS